MIRLRAWFWLRLYYVIWWLIERLQDMSKSKVLYKTVNNIHERHQRALRQHHRNLKLVP